MIKLRQINRHIVGISAVAIAIAGLGIAANANFSRQTETISQMSSTQNADRWANATNQPWANPAQLNQIPSNAYGSAQPSESARPNAMSETRTAVSPSPNPSKTAKATGETEAQNWTDREWEIASKAVAAYRMAGKAAQALVPNRGSETSWQPPEEIANGGTRVNR
ncbi:MAG: hypothetical protein ACR652_20215 [Methylocystis sp.]|uniref:hypothetical protein n=1 Tax=Methylocystis sp. TaxID=1911079 RepID=UPI003DA1D73F